MSERLERDPYRTTGAYETKPGDLSFIPVRGRRLSEAKIRDILSLLHSLRFTVRNEYIASIGSARNEDEARARIQGQIMGIEIVLGNLGLHNAIGSVIIKAAVDKLKLRSP